MLFVVLSPLISWSELSIQEKLGEGASGEVYRALWIQPFSKSSASITATATTSSGTEAKTDDPTPTLVASEVDDGKEIELVSHPVVAVKLYKSDYTSDGRPEDEMSVSFSFVASK